MKVDSWQVVHGMCVLLMLQLFTECLREGPISAFQRGEVAASSEGDNKQSWHSCCLYIRNDWF